MINVRPATLNDIPWMLGELVRFDEFFGASRSLFPDLDYAKFVLTTLIETQKVFVAVEEDGDEVQFQGFIAGVLAPHYFNPKIMVLTELLWWVPPELRGGRAGAALFSMFMEVGHREADWIVMTLEEKSPVRAESLVSRGFQPYEQNFLFEVNK